VPVGSERTIRAGLAEVLVALGGVAAIVGSTMDWFRVRVGLRGVPGLAGTVTSRGIDGWDGKVTLGAGILVLLMALLMFLWRSAGQRVVLGAVALVGSLVAGGMSAFDATTDRARFIDANAPELARRARISVAVAKGLYRRLFDSGALRISLATGIFLVIAGGAVGALASIFSLGKSPEEASTT
jgi:hypothetical protein